MQRDEVANWLVRLNSRFHFMPETGALAISLLDRFLRQVKVNRFYCTSTSRHLSLAGVFLRIKIC